MLWGLEDRPSEEGKNFELRKEAQMRRIEREAWQCEAGGFFEQLKMRYAGNTRTTGKKHLFFVCSRPHFKKRGNASEIS